GRGPGRLLLVRARRALLGAPPPRRLRARVGPARAAGAGEARRPAAEPRLRMSPAGKAAALAGLAVAHALALSLPFVGLRPRDWVALAVLYLVASFAVAVALHRYFAHR